MPGVAAVPGLTSYSAIWSRSLEDAVSDLVWASGGKALLVGSADGRLHRFTDTGAEETAWQGHQGGVIRLRPRPGQEHVIASAGEDGRVLLWDSRDGSVLAEVAQESGWVEHLAWTPNGHVLATAASKTISLWRDSESLGVWYDARRQVLAMAWAPDNKRLATASNKGLYLWRLDQGGEGTAEPMQLLSFPGAPVAVAWQPSGKALAVGTQDGFLQVWRQAAYKAGPRRDSKASQLTMRGYPGKVTCLAWHPSRYLIATAGGPDVVLWDLPTTNKGAKGHPLRHHQRTVTALAWSAGGSKLASGDRDGQVCLWDQAGALIHSHCMSNEISCLAWHSDGERLAVGDTNGALQLLGCDAQTTRSDITARDARGIQ